MAKTYRVYDPLTGVLFAESTSKRRAEALARVVRDEINSRWADAQQKEAESRSAKLLDGE